MYRGIYSGAARRYVLLMCASVGSGGCAVEHRTVNRGDGGSIPLTTVSKLRQFCSPHVCLCLSEETLKAGGPFYLVSMPGEINDPTRGKCVVDSLILEKDNSKNQ